MPSRQQFTKTKSGCGKLLLRRRAPPTRRTVALFCAGAHKSRFTRTVWSKSFVRGSFKLLDNSLASITTTAGRHACRVSNNMASQAGAIWAQELCALAFRAEKRNHLPVEGGQIRRLPTAD